MKAVHVALILLIALLVFGHEGFAQPQPPAGQPPQIDGFVSVDTLPAAEQLPAARLLIIAYAFVWVAIFFYVWSLWKRLGKVEGELHQLAKRTGANTR
jgi:CcmD family protein